MPRLNQQLKAYTLEQFLRGGGKIKRCPTVYAFGSDCRQGNPILPEDAIILQAREAAKRVKKIPKQGWAVYWAYRKLRAIS